MMQEYEDEQQPRTLLSTSNIVLVLTFSVMVVNMRPTYFSITPLTVVS